MRAPFGFGGGLRFQVAFALSNLGDEQFARPNGNFTGGDGFDGNGDRAQTALEPFIQYVPPGSGFYGRLGTLMALDSPLGPPGGKGNMVTIRLALGAEF